MQAQSTYRHVLVSLLAGACICPGNKAIHILQTHQFSGHDLSQTCSNMFPLAFVEDAGFFLSLIPLPAVLKPTATIKVNFSCLHLNLSPVLGFTFV